MSLKNMAAACAALAFGNTTGFSYVKPSQTKTYSPIRKRDWDYYHKPNSVKNPKQAKQINQMHTAWAIFCFPSTVNKPEADPTSVSSIKKQYGCHRQAARLRQDVLLQRNLT